MGGGVSKFTISLPKDILAEIDAEAADRGQTRSGVIREATVAYLERRHAEYAAAARRRAVDEALGLMKAMASAPCLDERPTLDILREIRDADGLGEPVRFASVDGEP